MGWAAQTFAWTQVVDGCINIWVRGLRCRAGWVKLFDVVCQVLLCESFVDDGLKYQVVKMSCASSKVEWVDPWWEV